MKQEEARRSPVRHFGWGLVIVLIAVTLTHWLRETSFLHRLEVANLDGWFLGRAPKVSSRVLIVLITDDDYQELFHSQSPLNEMRVGQLIAAVGAAGAQVI